MPCVCFVDVEEVWMYVPTFVNGFSVSFVINVYISICVMLFGNDTIAKSENDFLILRRVLVSGDGKASSPFPVVLLNQGKFQILAIFYLNLVY